jgi:site-specific recombinase XerD
LTTTEAKQETKQVLSEDTQQNVERFIQWLRSKRYSRNTVKVYAEAIGVFLRFFSNKPLCEIDNNDRGCCKTSVLQQQPLKTARFVGL